MGHLQIAVGRVVVADQAQASAPIATEGLWPTSPALSRVVRLATVQATLEQRATLRLAMCVHRNS